MIQVTIEQCRSSVMLTLGGSNLTDILHQYLALFALQTFMSANRAGVTLCIKAFFLQQAICVMYSQIMHQGQDSLHCRPS